MLRILRLLLLIPCLGLTGTAVVSGLSLATPTKRSSPPYSNRQRLDEVWGDDASSQAQLSPTTTTTSSSRSFPRTWIPLASVGDLDPDRPTPLQFLGANYVCYRANSGDWVVLDDVCAHRTAPLSEGRIDREKNVLECAYHGWQFAADGSCARIPQLADANAIKARADPRACVASYPVQVTGDILWAWLWSADVLSVAGTPEAFPEYMMANVTGQAYTRDLPYGWDTLLENLVDPSHVPFAHHNLQGTRDDAIPINMTSPQSIGPTGFRVDFSDRTIGKFRRGYAAFRAPYVIFYQGDYVDEDGVALPNTRPFALTVFCIPTRPGWSRLLVTAGGFDKKEEDKESVAEQKKKSLRSILIRSLVKAIPRWLMHIFSGRFLDSDLAFLHYQEREARRRTPASPVADAYFMPAPADRCIAAMRTWVRTYASAWESLPLPESPVNRADLFDRQGQHVSHCASCQGALRGIQVWRRNTYLVLVASIVTGLSWTRLASIPAAVSLLLLPLLHTVEKGLTQGGYDHYKS